MFLLIYFCFFIIRIHTCNSMSLVKKYIIPFGSFQKVLIVFDIVPRIYNIPFYQKKKLKNLEEDPTCSICLGDIENGSFIKKLHCGHYYHTECIDPWLLKQKAVCPICRKGIYGKDEWVPRSRETYFVECYGRRTQQRHWMHFGASWAEDSSEFF